MHIQNLTIGKAQEHSLTQRRNKGILYEIWHYRSLMLMLLPTLLYFVIFRYGSIFGIVIAFQDYRPIAGQGFIASIIQSPWVGFKHFSDFFSSMNGVQIIINTVLISIYKIIFGFPAPIILALLLNEVKHQRFKKTVQTISYLPHFISWVILAGILRIIFNPDTGVILPLFEAMGKEPINLLGDPKYFRMMLVVTDIWVEVGWGSIIYLAALSGIDAELYEAAIIDGAGKLQQLLHITLPGIASTIVIMFILRVGNILDAGFDQVFNLINPAVASVGEIIDTYVYEQGLLRMNFSYSTAIGLFKSFIGLLLVVTANFIAKRLGQEGIW
ncbi:ABC transporter permease [Mahella australiensis]|uniref:Carbohydrate ABC transporter membrane protein 1, CUT1 family n=1 Tax=Mahella australiensis (strain DSM 15567 / CIP 107919 / 50-1 BON) TaxID=697281 RepID=F3ZZA2_MAHA5|nr:ABC transporter permease subunit [Mahella australiensis]AEE97884.1 carbohydrate ABC transporter membrane protein 1, CUT1 family [Mahella australiensis 50-1 BON]